VNLLSLVLVNLGRNKRRTILTMLSVMIALFLFCALRGVLDTLQASIKVGSETRLVTRNKISLIFPLPLAYRDRIAGIPGVKDVAYGNWFGGRDPQDEKNFYAQFGVSENYIPIYASDIDIVSYEPPQAGAAIPADTDPKLASYALDREGCVVGEQLFQKMKWKLGQKVVVSGTIFPGTWTYNIRAVYRAKNPAMGEQSLFFHWKYLSEKGMGGQGQIGWFVLELSDPRRAGEVTQAVDAIYTNSAAATHTETERAFQAGFVSMYGNVPFLIGVIGLAVVFAILMVAANTMMMATRERTAEVGVMKTLGFEDGTIFGIVLAEAAVITLGGGFLGALLAKVVIEGSKFNAGGLLPPMVVSWATVVTGVGIAVLMGATSGIIPALQASRLKIVDALRRVE
jgi:putative ABC transport system permease protein